VSSNNLVVILGAIAASAIILLGGAILLNPGIAQIKIAPSSAGEEAIGIASLFFKSFLIILPFTFFVIAGTGMLLTSFTFRSQGKS